MDGWAWSDRVDEAGWIAERQPAGCRVCSVPTGYEAYVRLLHPIMPLDPYVDVSSAQVRWAQVAAWSGATLGSGTQFWQLALPEHLPDEPMPGGGGPASDVLGAHDAAALVSLLRGHTTTPERCWFGIWDGHGWDNNDSWAMGEGVSPELAQRMRDPVPRAARAGPRVRLPGRDYLLYNGPVEAGLAFLPDKRELADLSWPADRAWFVYGDVDLTSTYVGGSAVLVDEFLATTELEAVRVDPTNPMGDDRDELPDWLADRVEAAVRSLLATESAGLSTSRFTVRFELGAPSAHPCQTEAGWSLRYHSDTPSEQSGWTSLRRATDLSAQLRHVVTRTVIDLVEQ